MVLPKSSCELETHSPSATTSLVCSIWLTGNGEERRDGGMIGGDTVA